MELKFLIIVILIIVLYNITQNNVYTSNKLSDKDYLLKKNYDNLYAELQNELNEKTKLLKHILEKQQQFEKKLDNSARLQPMPLNTNNDIVDERDRRVLHDALYPIINRPDRPIIDTYRQIALAKNMNTNEIYLVIGRRKHRNSSQGDYYLINISNNSHIKIPLTDQNNRPLIPNFDDLPEEIEINHGILEGTRLKIQELKNAELGSPYI